MWQYLLKLLNGGAKQSIIFPHPSLLHERSVVAEAKYKTSSCASTTMKWGGNTGKTFAALGEHAPVKRNTQSVHLKKTLAQPHHTIPDVTQDCSYTASFQGVVYPKRGFLIDIQNTTQATQDSMQCLKKRTRSVSHHQIKDQMKNVPLWQVFLLLACSLLLICSCSFRNSAIEASQITSLPMSWSLCRPRHLRCPC